MEIQQENHILLHYKDSKVGLIEQAAACFGIRRAFSMFPKCVGMITTHWFTLLMQKFVLAILTILTIVSIVSLFREAL